MGWKNMRVAVLALTLFGVATVAQAQPLTLQLICDGTGTYSDVADSDAFVIGSDGKSALASGSTASRGATKDRLRVRIAGNAGSIRPPRIMLPPFNRATDGWLQLTDIKEDGSKIRGRVNLNMLNKPSVVIDRTTGDIDIKGLARFTYSGTCAPDTDGAGGLKF